MTERPLTILFMPESAYGPTNQCIGVGDVAAAARASRGVRGRGVVEGQARRARLRGGPRRPRARARARPTTPSQDAGGVLEGVHPRHRAGVPQADGRAARDVHAADLAGAHRRRPLLRAAAARDHRPGAARRDRRGQRRRLPRAADLGCAVRPDHVLQPARGTRAGDPAGLLRAAGGRPRRVGVLPRGVRPHAPRGVGVVRRLGRRAGRSPAAGPRVRAHERARQPLRVPRGGRLHRRAAARRDVAPDGLERPRDRRAVRRARGGRRPARGQRADLPLARVARQRRRRPDEAARRRARPHAAPLHREQGPAGGRVRARRQHGRRRVPARRPR